MPEKKVPSLRHALQMWLQLFVFIAFCITFGLSYFFQTKTAKNLEALHAASHLDYIGNQIKYIENDLNDLKAELSNGLLEKARIFSLILKDVPSLVHNKKFLSEWSRTAEIKEVSILDENGVVIEAFPERFIGTDFKELDFLHPYLPLIVLFCRSPFAPYRRGDCPFFFEFGECLVHFFAVGIEDFCNLACRNGFARLAHCL